LDKKHKIYLINSKIYCTFAAGLILKIVAIATKILFALLWIYLGMIM